MFETARFTDLYSGLEKKTRQGQVDFPIEQETFCPSLPDGQAPRQAVR